MNFDRLINSIMRFSLKELDKSQCLISNNIFDRTFQNLFQDIDNRNRAFHGLETMLTDSSNLVSFCGYPRQSFLGNFISVTVPRRLFLRSWTIAAAVAQASSSSYTSANMCQLFIGITRQLSTSVNSILNSQKTWCLEC